MVQSIEVADVVFWLNATGLAFGAFGTALIYFFGVPRQSDTGGAVHLILEQRDEAEVTRISLFKRWGNVGLGLIMLAFMLQLGALFADRLL